MTDQLILLNPGPVVTDPRVREALAGPDQCHREPEVDAVLQQVRTDLVRLSGGDDRHAAVVLTGSGTAAVEAAVLAAAAHGRILVLDNGHYGARLAEIAAAHGLDHDVLVHGWGHPLDLDALARRLQAWPRPAVVAVVQHETSTGMLNDLRAVARVAHAAGALVVVDAVSSLGCEDVDLAAGDADWLAASSNKCLEGAAGLAFVVATRDLLARTGTPGGYYLDLARHYAAQEAHRPAFTPAVPVLMSLQVALGLALEETVPARRARYLALTARVRAGLEELGLRVALAPQDRASMLTCVDLPDGWTYPDWHAALRREGFVVYASQGELARHQFRIATMGCLTGDDVERLLTVMAGLLRPGGTR